MALQLDVYKDAIENLNAMNCAELLHVLCSFEGVNNIDNSNNPEELLTEAKKQVRRAFGHIASD